MNTGVIIPIAYPDAYVQYSEGGLQQAVLSTIGVGKKGFVKAGHALLLLIENKTGKVQYFDFGRYVTPSGHGRVRGEITDKELEIPIKAKFNSSNELINFEEIILWLEAHPEKTHGEGKMIASVCNDINYQKAYDYLIGLQEQGSIPYKAFGNIGSNCSRLVTDALIKGTTNKAIAKILKRNNKFTPSPLGNVKHGAFGKKMFTIYNGKIEEYTKSIFKDNISNFFDNSNIPTLSTNKRPKEIDGAQLLEGIGAAAYFKLEFINNEYVITRYTGSFKQDFQGVFTVDKSNFDILKNYEFIYDSNCSYCHIKQNESIYRFDIKK